MSTVELHTANKSQITEADIQYFAQFHLIERDEGPGRR
ncbi:hypothetical protein J2X67_005254 [Variovorax sp. 3319]|nr:hypothetical protein [Variovorax sp. 3319]